MGIQSIGGLGLTQQTGLTTSINQDAPSNFATLLAALEKNSASASNSTQASKGLTVISSGVQAPAQEAAPLTKSQQELKDFNDYMNESEADKFEDMWLAQHHMTRDDLKKMSPQERKQIMDQIADELKKRIEQKVEEKTAASVLS